MPSFPVTLMEEHGRKRPSAESHKRHLRRAQQRLRQKREDQDSSLFRLLPNEIIEEILNYLRISGFMVVFIVHLSAPFFYYRLHDLVRSYLSGGAFGAGRISFWRQPNVRIHYLSTTPKGPLKTTVLNQMWSIPVTELFEALPSRAIAKLCNIDSDMDLNTNPLECDAPYDMLVSHTITHTTDEIPYTSFFSVSVKNRLADNFGIGSRSSAYAEYAMHLTENEHEHGSMHYNNTTISWDIPSALEKVTQVILTTPKPTPTSPTNRYSTTNVHLYWRCPWRFLRTPHYYQRDDQFHFRIPEIDTNPDTLLKHAQQDTWDETTDRVQIMIEQLSLIKHIFMALTKRPCVCCSIYGVHPNLYSDMDNWTNLTWELVAAPMTTIQD